MINVVLGTQWGDEGKGKLVDYFTKDSDVVARFQGGANAGHTIVVENIEYILHLIPSGVLHKDKICAIGNGVVLDPISLIDEIKILKEKNIFVQDRFLLSEKAHLILPYHRLIDVIKEISKGKDCIGTTARGIGPCYSDKINRIGVTAHDLLDRETLSKKIKFNFAEKIKIIKKINDVDDEKIKEVLFSFKYNDVNLMDFYDPEEIINTDKFTEYLLTIGEKLKNNIENVSLYLNNLLDQNKNILAEGAQGTMLDIDFGTYPFVTSSVTTIGNVISGLGVNPKKLNKITGIVKAYTTRVGSGPFPTELNDDVGEKLRKEGSEFGATTGRARRCGWLDLVVVKHSCMLNGINSIAITKLDVLSKFEKIKYCKEYKYDDKIISHLPYDLDKVEPIYQEIDGWNQDISNIRNYNDLPENAKKYIKIIEDFLNVKIDIVSVGPKREETIIKE
jgi:adenylosuccinate synthase